MAGVDLTRMDPEAAVGDLANALSQPDLDAKGKPASNDCYKYYGICCGCSWALLIWIWIIAHLLCWTGLATGTLSWLQGTRAPLTGTYSVGTIRGRLPAGGTRACGLFAQLTYPIEAGADLFEDQWFPYMREVAMPRYFADDGKTCLGEALIGDAATRGPLAPQAVPMASSEGAWPIVIFSSGLYGSVEWYQQFAMDMASTGKVVIALEHEDGAGYYASDCEGNDIFYQRPPPEETNLTRWRRPFLETRKSEYNATVLAIQETLNAADIADPSPIEQVLLKGSLDKMTLMGHSFGGCSSFYYMNYLAQEGMETPFVGAILMDMWTDPLVEADYITPLLQPFVMMTSDKWRANSWTINEIMRINGDNALAGVQVVGTTHDWISENHLFMQPWVERNLAVWLWGWNTQMGSANYVRAFSDTAQAVKDSQDAFLDETLQAGLSETLLAINTDVIIPVWAGVDPNAS